MYAAPTNTISYNYWIVPVLIRKKIMPVDIIQSGCDAFGVDVEVLKSPSRKKYVVRARNIIMYVLKKKSELSLAKIGAIFNRDHTTVIYAIRSIDIELSMAHTRQQMVIDLRSVENNC